MNGWYVKRHEHIIIFRSELFLYANVFPPTSQTQGVQTPNQCSGITHTHTPARLRRKAKDLFLENTRNTQQGVER